MFMIKLKFNLSGIALFPALAIPLITSNYMFGALQTAKAIIAHDIIFPTLVSSAWVFPGLSRV